MYYRYSTICLNRPFYVSSRVIPRNLTAHYLMSLIPQARVLSQSPYTDVRNDGKKNNFAFFLRTVLLDLHGSSVDGFAKLPPVKGWAL